MTASFQIHTYLDVLINQCHSELYNIPTVETAMLNNILLLLLLLFMNSTV